MYYRPNVLVFFKIFPEISYILTIDGYIIWLMALLGSLAKSLYTALWTMNAIRRMTLLMMLKMTETPNPDWLSYNWRSLLAQETFISKRSPWRKVLFDMLTLIFVFLKLSLSWDHLIFLPADNLSFCKYFNELEIKGL